LWQHPTRPWNHGRYGVCVGDTVEDTDGAIERVVVTLVVADGVTDGMKIFAPKK
jgi:hypothetical protein